MCVKHFCSPWLLATQSFSLIAFFFGAYNRSVFFFIFLPHFYLGCYWCDVSMKFMCISQLPMHALRDYFFFFRFSSFLEIYFEISTHSQRFEVFSLAGLLFQKNRLLAVGCSFRSISQGVTHFWPYLKWQ